MSFLYHRPSDRLTGTWSLSTGTARSGYGASNVQDSDPSNPCWITGTTIRLVCDLGSAVQVDHVYLFGHNLTNASVPKVQLHTADSWGSPDASVTLTVPTAYEDGFAYNLHADIAAAYPTAVNRTKQYLSIVNTVANAATVYIGEVWIVGSSRTFSRGVKYGFTQPRTRLTADWQSKRGVSTVYDFGAIARGVKATFPHATSDHDAMRALEADARGGARPFPIVLEDGGSGRIAEPLYVRFASSPADAPYTHPSLIPTDVEFAELGCGQVLGA